MNKRTKRNLLALLSCAALTIGTVSSDFIGANVNANTNTNANADNHAKITTQITALTSPATITAEAATTGASLHAVTWQNEEIGASGANISATLDIFSGTLTVSGTGSMKDWDKVEDVPWSNINRLLIKSLVIESGVSGIGAHAFEELNMLRRVKLPATVTYIGTQAFSECKQLSSISFPNRLHTIGESAFFDCTGLSSLELPSSLRSIGSGAFAYCSKLSNVVIPYGVKRLGMGAFSFCSGLRQVELQEGVEVIGDGAFSACTNLKTVIIPKSLRKVEWYAFDYCSRLTHIFYYGRNKEAWNEIEIGEGNEYLFDCALCYYRAEAPQVKNPNDLSNYWYMDPASGTPVIWATKEAVSNAVNSIFDFIRAILRLFFGKIFA